MSNGENAERENKRGKVCCGGIQYIYFYPAWWEWLLWHCRWTPLSCRRLRACRAAPKIHAGVTHILRALLTYIWENTRTQTHSEPVETRSDWESENVCRHLAWIYKKWKADCAVNVDRNGTGKAMFGYLDCMDTVSNGGDYVCVEIRHFFREFKEKLRFDLTKNVWCETQKKF